MLTPRDRRYLESPGSLSGEARRKARYRMRARIAAVMDDARLLMSNAETVRREFGIDVRGILQDGAEEAQQEKEAVEAGGDPDLL